MSAFVAWATTAFTQRLVLRDGRLPRRWRNPTDAVSAGNYRREHVVGIDGKVFDSPLRTLDTERVDRRTGELRAARQDPARQRYGEAGTDGLAWGILPISSARHRRLYGMRQDTESFNAQLDRAFYGRRLSASGVHNQATIVCSPP